MKHLKHVRFLIVLLTVIAIFTASDSTLYSAQGAAKNAKPTKTSEPAVNDDDKTSGISVIDMVGREIYLDAPAERIIALTASDCEIIYALGAEETLVGRGMYCDYPPEALDIDVVESGSGTNIEQIIALEPQVVLMNKMAQELEDAEELERAGITAIISNAADIEGIYESITLIGKITGKNTEAEELINEMKETFNELNTNTVDSDKSVYFEVSPLEWGLWTAGKGTYMNEIAEIIGISNIFEDVEGWAEISEEQVISRDPDYIVTIAMYFGDGPEPVEEIIGRHGWGDIKAVKENNVFLLNADEISRPGPRLMDAARMLHSLIYETE